MSHTKSPHSGRCPVTGKAQYKNKKVAKATVRRYAGSQSAYRCDEVCGYWHVGNPPTPGESRERMRKWREMKAKQAEIIRLGFYTEGTP